MNPQNYEGPINPDPQQPQQVFVSRPLETMKQEMSPELRQKCEESKAKYPHLNLSEGEYIISAIKRHPIGLVQIWAVVAVIIAAFVAIVAVIAAGTLKNESGDALIPAIDVALPALLLSMLVLLFGFVQTIVYNANRFYLTNESVIQNVQISLFIKREQTVSLGNIEDASFFQKGIIPSIFDYGLIRLSTQGDETTYRFNYVSNPKNQISLLNNAVEAFKNGRPVVGHY